MIYHITSDASFNIKRSHYGWAFIAGPSGQPKTRAHGQFTIPVNSPAEAELMAIGHAANALHLRYELQPGDKIVVHTDCRSVIHYLKYLSLPHRLKNERLRKIASVVYGTIIQRRGVSVDYRLEPDNNPSILWCHYQSKL